MNYIDELMALKNQKNAEFSKTLIPNLKEEILGVYSKDLKLIAKNLIKENKHMEFMNSLPHKYHEENIIHANIISYLNIEYNELIKVIYEFLPYVQNWSVCDSLLKNNKTILKNKDIFFEEVLNLLNTHNTYYLRFGILMCMTYFLEDKFIEKSLEKIIEIKDDDYYILMGKAWYFATALIEFSDQIIPILLSQKLDIFTHNKTIQKARESYRIPVELKEYLSKLRRKQ